jgi:protein SCO1/2
MKTLILMLMALATITTGIPCAEVPIVLPPCCRKVEATGKHADKSLYQLDSTWTSDVGREVKLEVFQGRPQIVTMFFSSCEYACPLLIHDLKRIEESLPASLSHRVDFLLVSFDTERDTPGALRAFRERQNLGAAHWSLLTGKPDDVRELAALLGVNYRKDARGQFSHSNIITVLNAQGEVAFQQVGLNKAPDETVAQISKLFVTETPAKQAR